MLGLVGCYISCAYIHWGAMGVEWSSRLKNEFIKGMRAPDYHETPLIMGRSFLQIIENMETDAHIRAEVAFYWLVTCGIMMILAVILLRLHRRIDRVKIGSNSESITR